MATTKKELTFEPGQISARIDADSHMLLIALPMVETPRPSSTGKTLIVASSGGTVATGVSVNGRPVKFTCSAFIPV